MGSERDELASSQIFSKATLTSLTLKFCERRQIYILFRNPKRNEWNETGVKIKTDKNSDFKAVVKAIG